MAHRADEAVEADAAARVHRSHVALDVGLVKRGVGAILAAVADGLAGLDRQVKNPTCNFKVVQNNVGLDFLFTGFIQENI